VAQGQGRQRLANIYVNVGPVVLPEFKVLPHTI
jgi:hypothetical protein